MDQDEKKKNANMALWACCTIGALIFIFLILFAATNPNNNTTGDATENDSAIVSNGDYNEGDYDNNASNGGGASSSQAEIMAEDVIKQFIKNADDADINVESATPMKNGHFSILMSIKNKNDFGTEVNSKATFIMAFVSGDWTELSNWRYGDIIIGDDMTNEINTIPGNLKKEEVKLNENKKDIDNIELGGLKFDVIESHNGAMRLYYDTKIKNLKTIRKIYSDMKKKNISVVMFNVVDPAKRGDEYSAISNGVYCDYDNNTVIELKKYVK